MITSLCSSPFLYVSLTSVFPTDDEVLRPVTKSYSSLFPWHLAHGGSMVGFEWNHELWVTFFDLMRRLIFFYIYNIQSNFLVIDPFLLLGTCRVIVFFFVLKLPFRSSSKTLFVLIDCSLENMDPFTLSAMCSISWNQTTSSFRHMSLRLQNLLVVFQSVCII